MDFALGDLDLRPDLFWEMTPAEYGRKGNGYRRRQKEEHHREELRWAHTRYLAALIININRDPKTPATTPEMLIPLSFDKVREAPKVTLPDSERMKAIADKYSKAN